MSNNIEINLQLVPFMMKAQGGLSLNEGLTAIMCLALKKVYPNDYLNLVQDIIITKGRRTHYQCNSAFIWAKTLDKTPQEVSEEVSEGVRQVLWEYGQS